MNRPPRTRLHVLLSLAAPLLVLLGVGNLYFAMASERKYYKPDMNPWLRFHFD